MSRLYIQQIENIWQNQELWLYNHEKQKQGYKLTKVVIDILGKGKERVCYKINGKWQVNEWTKKAILLYFRFARNKIISSGELHAYDKVAPKFDVDWEESNFEALGVRIIPGAYIREGAFLGKNSVIMPSFINIGAYIGENTMIDSMTTIGSCAQIGSNCHISSNVTIGGVLEPIVETPVIIEDKCFIGSGSQITEGVQIEQGAVLGSGLILSSSTKIYNRQTKEITYGRIPPYSVVVPGIINTEGNNYGASPLAAIIVKTVDEQTKSKIAINEILRD